MNESEIGGCEITFGVKFNGDDERTYLDKVNELLNDVIDIIEERNHEYLIAVSKPLEKDEVN